MIVPTKFTRLSDTALATAAQLLPRTSQSIGILQLYHDTASDTIDLDRFLLALDILYVLGRVEIDIERKLIRRVD